MDQAWIHRFYQVVTPYAVIVLSILFVALVVSHFKYLKKKGYPPLVVDFLTITASIKTVIVSKIEKLSFGHREAPRTPEKGMISNPALKKFLADNHLAVEYFIHSMVDLLFFVSGIGRFRTVAFLSAYSFLKGALLILKTSSRLLTASLVPLLIVLFFKDMTEGQIYPVFAKITPFIIVATLFLLICLDNLVTRRIRKEVMIITGQHFFTICPRCKYDNSALVESCIKCDYRQGVTTSDTIAHKHILSLPGHAIIAERKHYKNLGLYDSLPAKALLFLNMDRGEFNVIAYRHHLGSSLFINDSRELMSYMILSTAKITFLHYFPNSEGWRFRADIPYEQIREVSAHMKRHELVKQPTLIITTSEDITYELELKLNDENIDRIKAIANCIGKMNEKLHPVIDLTKPDNWRSEISEATNMDVKDYFKSPWGK